MVALLNEIAGFIFLNLYPVILLFALPDLISRIIKSDSAFFHFKPCTINKRIL